MAQLLQRRCLEKVWGLDDLPRHFAAASDQRIGEIWFEPLPLIDDVLIKYLFTGEKLSVQVHPSDENALRMGVAPQGKAECWLVMASEPDAKVALGLDKAYSKAVVREAARSGEIEGMLAWHSAPVGSLFVVPPGTIHAIGGGLTLVEVQQNTDVTFRLFDYGRPRELHLEQALKCAVLDRHPAELRSDYQARPNVDLTDGLPFSAEFVRDEKTRPVGDRCLIVPLSGALSVNPNAAEQLDIPVGECAMLEASDILHDSAGAGYLMVKSKR